MTPAPPSPDSPEVLARVHAELALVLVIAKTLKRHLGRAAELDDLVSMGREGLLSAARSFDVTRGVPFRHWASLRVRGAMIDGVRRQSAVPRTAYKKLQAIEAADRVQDVFLEERAASPGAAETPERADGQLSDHLAAMATAMAMGLLAKPNPQDAHDAIETGLSPEEALAQRQLMEAVRSSVRQRPDAERQLLERHYFDGVTFEAAATELGLSKSWASRLHARAIEAVARDLKRSKIAR